MCSRAFVAAASLCLGASAFADSDEPPVAPEHLQAAFPGAAHAEEFEGTPPAASVYKDGKLAGYLVSTYAAVGSTGYSGKPLDVLVGVSTDAVVTGAVLVRHSEPILVIGVGEEQLARYVSGFRGIDLKAGASAAAGRAGFPDAISGATVSSAVIRDAIVRTGRAVARSRGLLSALAGERLDRESIGEASWPELVAGGSIASARFTGERDDDDVLLLEVYAALLTPPRIGENLLGKLAYNRLVGALGPDGHIILIAANGLASVKGTGFVRSGRFDRLQIVQGERTLPVTTAGYTNIEELKAAGAPSFREIGVFTLRHDSGFDPLKPWRLDVRLPGEEDEAPSIVSLRYELPARYRLREPGAEANAEAGADVEPAADVPLWREIWA